MEENFKQSLSAFLLLFGGQKIIFESPFDLHYHLFIIEFFWFDLLPFKLEKRIYIKAVMLLICVEVLREGFFCFPGKDWKMVCRKLLSPVKLCQRFWISNVDQNLNTTWLIVAICTVLFYKPYTVFRKKSPQVKEYAIFSSKCSK